MDEDATDMNVTRILEFVLEEVRQMRPVPQSHSLMGVPQFVFLRKQSRCSRRTDR
jgi:hypothetical protein